MSKIPTDAQWQDLADRVNSKWVPDFANGYSLGINSSAPGDGFITAYYSAYTVATACQVTIKVNGFDVAYDYAEAGASSGAVIATASAFVPVSAGDTITTSATVGHTDRIGEVIFFPGKWV